MMIRDKVLLLGLQVCLLNLFSSHSVASDYSPVVLRVQYTTIENPVVFSSISSSEVKFNVFLKVQNYELTDGDLICSLFNQVNATITKIGDEQFVASCTFMFDAKTPAGLQIVYMRERQELIGNQQKFKMVPDNARSIYSRVEKDSFGQAVQTSAFGYEIFSQQAMFVGAPIAINPPTSYTYPVFPRESEAYVIFDVRNVVAQDLKVSLDGKRKVLTVECPNFSVPKSKPPIVKTSRTILVYKNWGSIYLTENQTKFNIDYLGSEFKGKKLNLTCSYFTGLKVSDYGRLPISYIESKPKMYSFPKK